MRLSVLVKSPLNLLMKIRRVLAGLSLLLLPVAGVAQTTITTSFGSSDNVTASDTTITAGTGVTIASGAVVNFRATTSVTLSPGFTASSGSTFRAFVFVDSDSDGLPDSWELQYFGSTTAGAAGGNSDGDSLTNLQEYLLGTNPLSTNASDSGAHNLKVHRP